mmetsp:Transcript_33612/g.60520  ORF Transcript_33612/g.60520 Transcript_33612/m.60520 type:complete len:225 (-) Transcript_33612:149-823(-)
MTFRKSRAFMRTHQTPHPILLHPLHEKIRNPQTIEQIPRALFFLPVILPQVQHVEDIGMPRFDVDGEGSWSFPAALVDVVGCRVEDAKHGYEAVGDATGAFDECSAGSDFVDTEADASGGLGNHSTSFQRIINTFDRIITHLYQETTAQLRMDRASMEQCWSSMGEITPTHQIICFKRSFKIGILLFFAKQWCFWIITFTAVNSKSHSHPHILRPFCNRLLICL